jgi:hypothetical protein
MVKREQERGWLCKSLRCLDPTLLLKRTSLLRYWSCGDLPAFRLHKKGVKKEFSSSGYPQQERFRVSSSLDSRCKAAHTLFCEASRWCVPVEVHSVPLF